ncbi:hypothetical protein FGG08_004253 [Glutinoglossum americanum]|uniref:Uncharacterized protein n=1 Tax=Glutinoglossum americanum TaxID=1670608 RepID=A0A9P8I0Z0_9PEZI|nr:hypothetical protein FGG08_004253 [Glutinoglossum americanum]
MINLAGDQLSRLLSSKYRWPNPEDSTGVWYRKMGRYDCWEATGPAREIFVQLAEQIKIYLESCSDPVPHTVTWSIYMIGKSKPTARPTVMFCCKEAKPRRTVRKMIDDSGILLDYPGVKTGDSTSPPDFDQLISLSSPSGKFSGHLAYSDSQKTVLCPPTENLIGSRVYIKSKAKDSDSLRQATAGGVVQWKGRYFGMTVSHAFHGDLSSPQFSQAMDDCPFEFNIDEDSDEDEIDEEFVEMTSRGSLTPESITSDYSAESDDDSLDIPSRIHSAFYGSIAEDSIFSNTTTADNPTMDEPASSGPLGLPTLDVVGELFLTSTDDPHSNLDYALFEIQQPRLQTSGTSIYAESVATGGPKDVEIVTTTGSAGLLRGRLSGTPSFMRSSRSKSFQEVWTARLNGRLARGDCGSWITDAQTGELYGHIVAGSPDTGVAFIIPAYQVFDDINKRLGGEAKLLVGDDLKPDAPTVKIICPSTNTWGRLSAWKLPLLQLLSQFPRPSLRFRAHLLLFHMLGDPIDTLWSAYHTYRQSNKLQVTHFSIDKYMSRSRHGDPILSCLARYGIPYEQSVSKEVLKLFPRGPSLRLQLATFTWYIGLCIFLLTKTTLWGLTGGASIYAFAAVALWVMVNHCAGPDPYPESDLEYYILALERIRFVIYRRTHMPR